MRKARWGLFGLGGLLFATLIFYLANPRFFGEHFVHFGGRVKQLEPLDGGRVLVIEDVQTGGGEDGPISVGDRWRIVDAATGKVVAGPHYVDAVHWASMSGDRFVAMGRHNLEIRGLDNTLLGTLDSFPNGASLRRGPNDVSLGLDGRVTAMSEDGRFYALDPHTLQSTPVAQRERASARASQLGSTSVKGLSFEGRPRAQINRQGPDYLEPSWLKDSATDGPIPAAGGLVVLHYQRMADSKAGRGPMFSAINAQGVEAWKYVLPFEHLHGVAVFGNLLVVAVDEHRDVGPGWLRAVDLTDGHETWKLAL